MLTNSGPFARARAMMALVAAMSSASAFQKVALQAQLNAMGPYQSRGHGRNKWSPSRHCVAMDQRAARKARNVKRHKAAMRRA